MDFKKLNRQLLLTQQYCRTQLLNTDKNFAAILRSINPIVDGTPLFEFILKESCINKYFYDQYVSWTKEPYATNNGDLIPSLFDLQLNFKEAAVTEEQPTLDFEGEILAFHFEDTLNDGAACAESFSFLDDYNCPPIDTWFYIQQSTLLAWIPKEFVGYVHQGVLVNPEACIEWYKDVEFETYSEILKQNSLIKVVNTDEISN